MNVFQKLLAKVGPVVISYRTDLDADEKALAANPGVHFLHWTRASGTTLEFMPPADCAAYPDDGVQVSYLFGTRNRYGLASVPEEIARYHANDGQTVVAHYFDGDNVREVTCERAVEIAAQYKRAVCAVWRNQKHSANG